MNQEQTKNSFDPAENAPDSTPTNPSGDINDGASPLPADSEEIDYAPVESVGSYGRLDESPSEESSENSGESARQA